jgi:hypothetical protein
MGYIIQASYLPVEAVLLGVESTTEYPGRISTYSDALKCEQNDESTYCLSSTWISLKWSLHAPDVDLNYCQHLVDRVKDPLWLVLLG